MKFGMNVPKAVLHFVRICNFTSVLRWWLFFSEMTTVVVDYFHLTSKTKFDILSMVLFLLKTPLGEKKKRNGWFYLKVYLFKKNKYEIANIFGKVTFCFRQSAMVNFETSGQPTRVNVFLIVLSNLL